MDGCPTGCGWGSLDGSGILDACLTGCGWGSLAGSGILDGDDRTEGVVVEGGVVEVNRGFPIACARGGG